MGANRFHDIGHFFRRKSDKIEQLISHKVYERFFEAYNAVSKNFLPDNWFQLAKTVDIPSMLALINTEDAPKEWVNDIVWDIDIF